jgi:hypothetical protein
LGGISAFMQKISRFYANACSTPEIPVEKADKRGKA